MSKEVRLWIAASKDGPCLFGPFSSRERAEQGLIAAIGAGARNGVIDTLANLAKRDVIQRDVFRRTAAPEDTTIRWELATTKSGHPCLIITDGFNENGMSAKGEKKNIFKPEPLFDCLACDKTTKQVVLAEIRDFLTEKGFTVE